MTDGNDGRPNPDALLQSIQSGQGKAGGKLKIFFGYAAGVGKTYAMLDDAAEQLKNGVDVVVGYVEPHTRPETMRLLEGLPSLPPKVVQYKGIRLREFDLDAALLRKPELILVDELAHTNAEGVRNRKRYQDVEELLKAGIDVCTTVNVQHIESLNDVVQDITKIQVRETVPDYIFDNADMVKLIDIEPNELIKRLENGKIYRSERAEKALSNFFTRENLRLLREIAMRKAADRISHGNQSELRMSEKMASTKLLVCIGPSPSSARCIRWTARTAEAFRAPWVAAYVEKLESRYLSEDEKKNIKTNMDLAEQLGAEIVTLNGDDLASSVAEYARLSGITNIVMGKSRNKKTLKNCFEMDLEDRLMDRRIRQILLPSALPIQAKGIGSPFGRRVDPIAGVGAMHEGIDFVADVGTPVAASAGGVVKEAVHHPEYGNLIELDHGNGFSTRYAHLSKILVRPGQMINRGQEIALSGNTGRSTGPHLHFEVRYQGAAQNPAKYLNLAARYGIRVARR